MLMRLMVKDFALIHRIELEFDSRFNVLTGETAQGNQLLLMQYLFYWALAPTVRIFGLAAAKRGGRYIFAG